MPELAEVECVRRVLKENIINLKINDIEIKYDKIVENDINYFIDSLKNQTYKDILRRGKYLIFVLDKGYIISHLRMEGKYFYFKEDENITKHTHVIFHLNNGYKLCYEDVRKFGRMKYVISNDIFKEEPLSLLGWDPILDDKIENIIIYDKIIKSNAPIKELLLRQDIITGLGNIYVDEVLFKSNINPLRKGKDISLEETNKICLNSKLILEDAIKHKGTTIKSYTSSFHVKGEYQNFLSVHTKKICPHCKMALTCVKIQGRTTYYCENCQR